MSFKFFSTISFLKAGGPRIGIQGLDPIRTCQCQAEDRLRTLYAYAEKEMPFIEVGVASARME